MSDIEGSGVNRWQGFYRRMTRRLEAEKEKTRDMEMTTHVWKVSGKTNESMRPGATEDDTTELRLLNDGVQVRGGINHGKWPCLAQ